MMNRPLLPFLLLLLSMLLYESGQLSERITLGDVEESLLKVNHDHLQDVYTFYNAHANRLVELASRPYVTKALGEFHQSISLFDEGFPADIEGLNYWYENDFLSWIKDPQRKNISGFVVENDAGAGAGADHKDAIDRIEMGVSSLKVVDSPTAKLQNRYLRLNPKELGAHQQYPGDDQLPQGMDPGVSAYDQVHRRFHPIFYDFLKGNDLYDIFLIRSELNDLQSQEDARVIYSVAKEVEFGKKLLMGPESSSELAEGYRHAQGLNRGEVWVSQIKPHLPSAFRRSQFLATPVFEGRKRVGVLVFQIDAVHLQQLLGEHYRADHKQLNLTLNNRLISQNNRLLISEKPLKWYREYPVRNQLSLVAMNRSGVEKVDDYQGKQVLSAYSTVNLNQGVLNATTLWRLATEVPLSDIEAKLQSPWLRQLPQLLLLVAAINLLWLSNLLWKQGTLRRPMIRIWQGLELKKYYNSLAGKVFIFAIPSILVAVLFSFYVIHHNLSRDITNTQNQIVPLVFQSIENNYLNESLLQLNSAVHLHGVRSHERFEHEQEFLQRLIDSEYNRIGSLIAYAGISMEEITRLRNVLANIRNNINELHGVSEQIESLQQQWQHLLANSTLDSGKLITLYPTSAHQINKVHFVLEQVFVEALKVILRLKPVASLQLMQVKLIEEGDSSLQQLERQQVPVSKIRSATSQALQYIDQLYRRLNTKQQIINVLKIEQSSYKQLFTQLFERHGYTLSTWSRSEISSVDVLLQHLLIDQEGHGDVAAVLSDYIQGQQGQSSPFLVTEHAEITSLFSSIGEAYDQRQFLMEQFFNSIDEDMRRIRRMDLSESQTRLLLQQWESSLQKEGYQLAGYLAEGLRRRGERDGLTSLAEQQLQLSQRSELLGLDGETLKAGVIKRSALAAEIVRSHGHYADLSYALEDHYMVLISELRGYRDQHLRELTTEKLDGYIKTLDSTRIVVYALYVMVVLFVTLFFFLVYKKLVFPLKLLVRRTTAGDTDRRMRALPGTLPTEIRLLDENTRRLKTELVNDQGTTEILRMQLKTMDVAQQIMSSIQTGLVVLDLEGRIDRFNPEFLRLFQLHHGDLFSQLLVQVEEGLFDLRAVKKLMLSIEMGDEGALTDVMELEHPVIGRMVVEIDGFGTVSKQSEKVYVEGEEFFDDQGLSTLVGDNISAASHKMSTMLQYGKSEKLYEMFSTVSMGVLGVSEKGVIEYLNPHVLTLFGYDEEELKGESVHRLLPTELREQHQSHLKQFFNQGDMEGRQMGEGRVLCAENKSGESIEVEMGLVPVQLNGEKFTFVLLSSPLSDTDWGKFRRTPVGRLFTTVDQIVLTFHDVTERTVLRDREATAQKVVAQTAYQAGLAEMSSNMLHNIGNAVGILSHKTESYNVSIETLSDVEQALRSATSIENLDQLHHGLRQSADLLRDVIVSGLEESGQEIRKGVEHIANIVRIQQEMARGDASRAVTFNLLSVIQDTVLMQEDINKKYRVEVVVDVQPEISDVVLPQNPFVQMLDNFVKNGRESILERQKSDATSEGVIQISVTAGMHDDFLLQVKDSGVGVNSRKLKEIFKHGVTTKEQGSGFGLHSASTFVQSVGGTIEMLSEGKNRGATMVVRLPIEVSNTAK